MRLQADETPKPDVIITEIGGTVGDIESQPFIEAARQIRHELGRDNVFFVHVSLVPFMGAVGRAEDQADAALGRRAALDRHPARRARAAQRPPRHRVEQAQDRAHVRRRRGCRRRRRRRAEHLRHPDDAARAGPRRVHRAHASASPVPPTSTGRAGTSCCAGRAQPEHEVTIGLVGKYIDLPDAYLSVTEALRAGGFAHETKVHDPLDRVRRLCETPEGAAQGARRPRRHLSCPAASASAASRASSARCSSRASTGIPTLGLCLGLQCMVIEYARNVAGLEGASSTEFDPDTAHPVIATMAEQVDIIAGGETWAARCGSASTRPSSPRARSSPSCTARPRVDERHRHRYEVNNALPRPARRGAGLVLLGPLARRQPRRVRRAAARRAPVLRRDAGAPRAALAPDRRRTRCSRRSSPPRALTEHVASTVAAADVRRERATVSLSGDVRRRRASRRLLVLGRSSRSTARSWNVRQDRVDLGAGVRSSATTSSHPGAVAVLALDDDRVPCSCSSTATRCARCAGSCRRAARRRTSRSCAPRSASSPRRPTTPPAAGTSCWTLRTTPGGSRRARSRSSWRATFARCPTASGSSADRTRRPTWRWRWFAFDDGRRRRAPGPAGQPCSRSRGSLAAARPTGRPVGRPTVARARSTTDLVARTAPIAHGSG